MKGWVLLAVPSTEVVLVGEDLNGHVGSKAAEPYERVHGVLDTVFVIQR